MSGINLAPTNFFIGVIHDALSVPKNVILKTLIKHHNCNNYIILVSTPTHNSLDIVKRIKQADAPAKEVLFTDCFI